MSTQNHRYQNIFATKQDRLKYIGEVYSIQDYFMKFVSDLRQVGGFLQVLWFPPTIKLTPTI